ncbi:MAG: hypothetical protein GY830_05725 [Bacteroidetes bacterium]|nr:hypothetical protein [Bacteroidota bacterium]
MPGILLLTTYKPKPPPSYFSIFCVAVLGVAQIFCGAVLIAASGGALYNFGSSLISEGVSDLIYAAKSLVSGKFDWKSYLMKKAISFGVIIMTFGVTIVKNIYKKIKGTYNATKDWGQKVYKNGKEVFSGIFKSVGTAVGIQIVNEGVHYLFDSTIEEDISKELRKTIRRKIRSEVIDVIRNNNNYKDAILIDKKTGKAYWQSKFNNYANDILKQKESEFLQICKTVSNIVAKKELTNSVDNIGLKILTRVSYTTFETLNEIRKLNDFLNDFTIEINNAIDRDKKEIYKQKNQLSNKNKISQNDAVSHSSSSYVNEEKYNSNDNNIFDIDSGKDFSNINNRPIKKLDIDINPLTFNFLNTLEEDLVSYMSGQVKGNIIKNLSDTGLATVSDIVPEVIAQMHKKNQIRNKNRALEKSNNKPIKVSEIDKIHKDFKSNKIVFKNDDLRRRADDIFNDTYKGSFDIDLSSEAHSVNIQVYDKNDKIIYSTGSKYGKTVKLKFSEKNGKGHYKPYNNIKINHSGKHSCLPDSIAATLKKPIDEVKKQNLAYLTMNQDKCKILSNSDVNLGKVDSNLLFLGGKGCADRPLNKNDDLSKYVKEPCRKGTCKKMHYYKKIENITDFNMPSFYDSNDFDTFKEGLQFYDPKYAAIYFEEYNKFEKPFGICDSGGDEKINQKQSEVNLNENLHSAYNCDDDPPLVFDYDDYERADLKGNKHKDTGLSQKQINEIKKAIIERNLKNLRKGKTRMFTSKEYNKYYSSPTWDRYTNERLKLLNPFFASDMRAMINEAFHKYGIKLRIGIEVLRSLQKQKEIYLEGRDPVTLKVINPKKIKTKAPPGASMHHYGWAVDLYEIDENGNSKNKFNRKKILKLAIKYGFHWGGHFSTIYDPAHFERTYGLKWRNILKKSKNQNTIYVDPFK